MYLIDMLIMNSGAIEKLALTPQFNSNGTPKPIVLVGANGVGKTGVLSVVVDGLVEIAAHHYQNLTAQIGMTRQYFRVLGGNTQRLGSAFELCALKFRDQNHEFYHRLKSGNVTSALLSTELTPYGPISNWGPDAGKQTIGPISEIQRIYENGVYVFFPSNRFETPHWANTGALNSEPKGDFSSSFTGQLMKPLVVQSALQALKPWIMNLMLDMIVPYPDIFLHDTVNAIRAGAQQNLSYQNTYHGLNAVLRAILRDPDVSVNWLNRAHGERRVTLVSNGKIAMPTIDCLSAGQATLLAIFGTILRYGDTGQISKPLDQVEGIVMIDEADAHLHADLQHEALPTLIGLFPRVQFIVTSHSPLFPLGMRKQFGDEGFSLIELPRGLTIDAERFSEFAASYAYFRATQSFENEVRLKTSQGQKPLVLCEGETDPKYLKAAAELLAFNDLANNVEFEWIGQKSVAGSRGAGKDHLDNAFKFLRNNPNLMVRKVVLLYDADTNKAADLHDNLFVQVLPFNPNNVKRKVGIENLLPELVLEDRFYREESIKSGSDFGSVKRLQKVELCNHLCDDKRDPSDFENFRATLSALRQLLMEAPKQDGGAGG